jgi:hypothetical protein
MSSAIDFDFNAVRMQGGPWQTGAKERLYPDRLKPDDEGIYSYTGNYRQERAATATQEDMPYKPEETGCCGFMKARGPPGRIIEFVSGWLSLFCLVGIVVALIVAVASKDDHVEIRLSKEVLMFTNETGMIQAMRHLQTEYNQFCKKPGFEIDLQVPTWDGDNAKQFNAGKNSTLYGMSASVHAGSISLFWVAWPIYLFSALFQFERYRQYCTPEKKEGLYKPWLGPDFSRWMEYLFTSPFQVFIVSTAFGFANRDTVLGLCGMQAALVLFGYDIEQQTKKKYNRAEIKEGTSLLGDIEPATKRRIYNYLWPTIRDIRGYVYLGVAWLLHVLIWSSIIMRFTDQDRHGKECRTDASAKPASEIPGVVVYIMISQFLAFTSFGVLNSAQFLWAGKIDRQEQFKKWNWYSKWYGILSVTAKLLLEVVILWYVANARTWPLAKPSTVVRGNLPSGQQCWAVQPSR